MRLIAIPLADHDVERTADRCWQAGATGIWEKDDELRVGVDEGDLDRFLSSLADLAPCDVTDVDAVELSGREVTVTTGGRPVVLWVPPTVFGDGTHETTSTCLDLLDGLVEPGDTVLDVGCGAGVLSIAAALAGGRVTGIDVDPAAVDATLDNAARNDVAVAAATTPLTSIDDTYDVVVANMTAGAMGPLLDDLVRVCRTGGSLLLSGLLEEQWPDIRDRVDGDVVAVQVVDIWSTALVRR